jgi:hypothetical protein
MGAVVRNDDVLPTVRLALVRREVVHRVSVHRRSGHRSDYRIGELVVVSDVVRQTYADRIWPLVVPNSARPGVAIASMPGGGPGEDSRES